MHGSDRRSDGRNQHDHYERPASPYHPVFNVERFANASRNKFFLCIESEDPQFDRHATAGFLESLEPEEIAEVAR